MARRDPPDVVVRVDMPGLDGVEVCRRMPAFSDAYVIMLTLGRKGSTPSSAWPPQPPWLRAWTRAREGTGGASLQSSVAGSNPVSAPLPGSLFRPLVGGHVPLDRWSTRPVRSVRRRLERGVRPAGVPVSLPAIAGAIHGAAQPGSDPRRTHQGPHPRRRRRRPGVAVGHPRRGEPGHPSHARPRHDRGHRPSGRSSHDPPGRTCRRRRTDAVVSTRNPIAGSVASRGRTSTGSSGNRTTRWIGARHAAL